MTPVGGKRWVLVLVTTSIVGIWITALVYLIREPPQARSQGPVAFSSAAGASPTPPAPSLRKEAGARGESHAEGERSTSALAAGAQDWGSGDAFPSAEGNNPHLPFKLSISPKCGSVGDKMTASVKTLPGTHLSLAVVYADGYSRNTWYAGPVDPQGRLVFPWVVPRDAPPGNGRVMVAAVGPDRKQVTEATALFRVVAKGGCP